MKIHLVFAPTNFSLAHGDLGKNIDPPLGILYIASYLREYCAQEVTLVCTDGMSHGYDETLDIILREAADVVGLSLVTPNALGAYRLSQDIRKAMSASTIIFGGPHATAMPEEPFERGAADVVVVGEGEQTFLELVEVLAQGRAIPQDLLGIKGLCLRMPEGYVFTAPRGFIQDLDAIPFPARDLIDMSRYSGYPLTKRRPGTTIFIARGCPFNCSFCSNNVWRCGLPMYRTRSPENVVAELRMLTAQGYREFFDNSDEFNTGLKRTKEMLRAIIASGLDISLKCQVRASPMDEEMAELMKRAGIWYLHLGIESGNEETIRGTRKKISLDEVERCCRLLQAQGIKIWGLFMYFNIWEEDGRLMSEDIQMSLNTLNYARKLYSRGLINFFGGSITTPIPGSELWEVAERHGLIKEECRGNWDLWYYKKELRLVSRVPNVPEASVFKLHQRTVKHTALCLIRNNVLDIKNIGFNLRRGLYYLKRQIYSWLGLGSRDAA